MAKPKTKRSKPKQASKRKPNARKARTVSNKKSARRVRRTTVRSKKRPSVSKRSRKNSVRGFGSRIEVRSRLHGGSKVTIRRRTTEFSPGIRIQRGPLGRATLERLLVPIALRHFKAIGKSRKSLYYVRLRYHFKLNGKKHVSHFSIGTTKIRNAEQFERYTRDVIKSFCVSLKGYAKKGFQTIFLTALIVQGYE